MKKKAIAGLLALTMAFVLVAPVSTARAAGFSDVKQGDWYCENVTLLAQFGIIEGMGDGTFNPNGLVRKGEFIKMLAQACSEHLYPTIPSTGVHWSEQFWSMLNEASVLEVVEAKQNANGESVQYTYPLVALKFNELEKPINRYEMAYLINRVIYMVYRERQMTLKSETDSYANHIPDYDSMDKSFLGSVEQVYSKGILAGYDDGSFQGHRNLTRAEAASVIVRLLWGNKRQAQTFAVEKAPPAVEPEFTSFAIKYRTMSNPDRRQALFGNPNKTHFTSAADAGSSIVNIQVPVWKLNEKTGQKTSGTAYLQVHRLVEKEVKAIFQEIYNSPEKFPIKSVGGARYSDTMRHSWGCAIDINPNENYYLHYGSGQQVGTLWKPGVNPYSITPNGSVVKAFAKYGWGWGGQGWSTAVDYMHFSILASGG